MDLYSLYLHVPFCRHRCSYCDFNTFAGQERLIPAYVEALCSEIRQVSASWPVGQSAGRRIPVHTVFFGGGTPSLLSAAQLSMILDTLRRYFDFQDSAGPADQASAVEITLEANPGTVTLEYLRDLRRLGINRLSFGMQSAHPDDLRLLERQHDFFDVSQAVGWARRAGFDDLNLDLIFGLPGQDLSRWQATIERALGLVPEHLSLYALTIEHGTPLQKRWAHGLIPIVDDDLAADMYEFAMQRLEEAGYEQYEISNWARRGPGGRNFSCRHNLQYWRCWPYLGFGAGAHGFAYTRSIEAAAVDNRPGILPGNPYEAGAFASMEPDRMPRNGGTGFQTGTGVRTMNVGGIRPYIERCGGDGKKPYIPNVSLPGFPAGPATRRTIAVDRHMEMQETMMVGLRLTQEGVAEAAFQERFGQSPRDVFGSEIDRLTGLGLLERTVDNHLRLTRRGRLLGNQVFIEFVG